MVRLQTYPPARSLGARTRTIPSLLFTFFSLASTAKGQEACLSIDGSTACPAYSSLRVSTDATLVGYFPFLANVTDTASFDSSLLDYASNVYPIFKYQNTFGCTNINPSNTTNIYARYTISYVCNSIVQNSVSPCGLNTADYPPICASSCADFAQSEQEIVSSTQLCGSANANVLDLLRADFTGCAQPSEAITGQCVLASTNEPNNCGFGNNLSGLCNFCASSTVNNTDSCCVTSQTESRCSNVMLPVYGSAQPQITVAPTTSGSPAATAVSSSADTSSRGLSGGQIAGVVVGSVVGAALIIGLIVFGCLLSRRRRPLLGEKSSFLNQPTPPRSGGTAASRPSGSGEAKFEAIPNARVTRMTALEAPSHGSPSNGQDQTPRNVMAAGDLDGASLVAAGAIGAFAGQKSDTQTPLRDAAAAAGTNGSSPNETDSSPENGNVRSEQMDAFKDYYSQDDIHPGDTVSTLWAYQPRADDEFELERGDMLRIVGIWDDGWATGIRVSGRAEDWDPERNATRDSAMSNNDPSGDSPPTNGNVKAFPLVCVCLPQHWSKTVDGENSQDSTPTDEDSPEERQE